MRIKPVALRAVLAGFFSVLFTPSVTHAALPANEVWREGLLAHRVGYGRLATGGAGGTLCTVSNLNDSGAGSLRACVFAPGPQWIIFSVSGTINLTSRLAMQGFNNNHDKTIDGRGANITVSSNSDAFQLSNVHNWIVHNITITDVNGFPVRLLGGTHTIWFDHVTMTGSALYNTNTFGVGSVGGENDNASTDITVSWCRFHTVGVGSGFLLIGPSAADSQHVNTRTTLHHNWYNQGYIRHPYMRHAKVHSFNNYFEQNAIGAQVSQGGRFYSENDIFEGQPGGYPRVHADPFGPSGTGTGAEGPSANVKVLNPWLVTGNETYQQLNASTIFNPASDYSYTPETPNAALRSRLIDPATGAGVVSNPYGTPTPTFSPPAKPKNFRFK